MPFCIKYNSYLFFNNKLQNLYSLFFFSSNPNRFVNHKKKIKIEIPIKNISYHPNFDSDNPYKYDIAIVELEENLKIKKIDDFHNQNCPNQTSIVIEARCVFFT